MQINQFSTFLSSLLPDVLSGRVLPAGMQRPYVWSQADVEALFDSILKGFPVGSFLYWQPEQKADLSKLSKTRLGPISPPDSVAPSQLLLDGQNRLATFAWICLEDDAPDHPYSRAEIETWLSGSTLIVDGATRSIRFVPTSQAGVGLRLPVWTINNSTAETHGKAMRLIRQKTDTDWQGISEAEVDAFIDFWSNCCVALQGARVTSTVIVDATPEEARDAFLKICRTGVPMGAEDFDNALKWAV